MSGDQINKDDLFLMMESYKNMIESNLQLMEKQDVTTKKIDSMCQSLTNIAGIIKEGFASVDKHHDNCANTQLTRNESLVKLVQDGHTATSKVHSGQNLKIFGLISLLCTIILGLVGLVYKLWPAGAPIS